MDQIERSRCKDAVEEVVFDDGHVAESNLGDELTRRVEHLRREIGPGDRAGLSDPPREDL
jgi:hypothetical protein